MQSIWKCGLEHCKVAKDIDIALLRSCRKDWWITMKNVQISQELFFLLVRYFLIGQEETEPEITKALEKKMDRVLCASGTCLARTEAERRRGSA